MAVYEQNTDGTVNVRINDKPKYFAEIANDVLNLSTKFSDVKIVCGDGAMFKANRAILSRCYSISIYFDATKGSGDGKG